MVAFKDSPKNVYRYVPVFRQLLNNPSVDRLLFSPLSVGVSVVTAVARIRDAAQILIKGTITHPDINAKDFASLWSNYIVREDSSGVMVEIAHKSFDRRLKVNKHLNIEQIQAVKEVKPNFLELSLDASNTVSITAALILSARENVRGILTLNGTPDPSIFIDFPNTNIETEGPLTTVYL